MNHITLNKVYKKKILANFFFSLVLLELFLMGSGRFLEISFLTVRMIFFVFLLSLSLIVYIYQMKIKNYVLWLTFIHIAILSFSSLVGLLNDANLLSIAIDIKPLLYFFMILPFVLFIQKYESIIKPVFSFMYLLQPSFCIS